MQILCRGLRRLAFPRIAPHIPAMPDLSPDDYRELAQLLREALAADKFFLSPQYKLRKAILDKLEPPSVREPLPPPKPAGEPSWAMRKKRMRR